MDEDEQTQESTTNNKKKPATPGRSIDIYAAQCEKCFKWRKIDTQEDYEEIRSRVQEDPFACEKNEGMSCRDAGDLDYDSTRTWVIDKPGLPRTPRGFKRTLVLRKDYSKMDAYYISPTGKKMRTRNEIAAFIHANQDYKDALLGDFNFTVPKVMEDTVPCGISRK
ncbi:Methyl-CpG DNA binding [Arabidopsis suecica]|uniref:Methyl-CpG DNA binding n=2 Tax=Arabidopsis TaxID=3701 RepID=A0A8T1XKI4_ARASU|nr:Methyl-CpG DNA binding [Arabidopsis suecica]